MADTMVVSADQGGKPLVPQDQSKKQKKPRNPLAPIMWTVVIVALIALAAFINETYYGSHAIAKQATARDTYPTESKPLIDKGSTDWSLPRYNRHDAALKVDFHEPNLWWQVRVNGKTVYTFCPINYPESTNFHFNEVVYSLEYRVAPPNECRENTGKVLSGEFACYYKPRS